MGVARRGVLTACSVTFLCGQALVAAFTTPGGVSLRSQQAVCDGRSSIRTQALSSSSPPSASEPRSDGRSGSGTTSVGISRARDMAAKARRRARDASRQTRSRDALTPPNMQGAEQATGATVAPPRPSEGTQALPPPPPPRLSPPQRLPPPEGSRSEVAPQAGRGIGPPPSTGNGEDASSEEVDAMQRRVREILDEYCNKVSPVEQWPPGRRIRVRGVDIFYKDTGARGVKRNAKKDMPTFVLLHGLAGSTASWDEVVSDLSEYGRVISFDRPGFGKTERVMPPSGLPWRLCRQTLGENPYSADFASKALFGILDRLGVGKVILVAHSLGAQVALRAARSRPDMVRAMVLVAPAVLNPLDGKFVMGRDPNANLFSPIINLRTRVEMTAKLAAFNLQLLQPGEAPLEAVRNMTLNGDVEERVQQNFHDRSLPGARPELISKYIEPLKDPLWDRGLLHFYKSLQGEVQPGEQLLQKALDVWRGPSMIITGDDDPTIPTQSSVYVAEVMEGRLVVMESCAHIPMDEKSEVFTSAVLSFANSEEVRNAWLADGKTAKSWW